MDSREPYRPDADGFWVRNCASQRQSGNYDEANLDVLRDMQERHFWYRGRHRFVLSLFARATARHLYGVEGLRVIDLGCGCGGWAYYLQCRSPVTTSEMAVGDSSRKGLRTAAGLLGKSCRYYEVDLADLGWKERWDVVFLLDVLEHFEDDEKALREVRDALAPGGLAIVTVPALMSLWSAIDEAAGHHRRYNARELRLRASEVGFEVAGLRYFMFLLCPLLALRRRFLRSNTPLDAQAAQDLIRRTHGIPAAPVNELLAAMLLLETVIGTHVPFPWGSSLAAVLRKPAGRRAAPCFAKGT